MNISNLRNSNVIVIILAICSGAFLYFTTPYGLGLSPDSVVYIKAAQGVLDGNGMRYFTSQWPPLYPSLIAAIGLLSRQEALGAARLLQSMLFTLMILGTFYYLKSISGKSKFIALSITILLVLQSPILYVVYYCWSELLFIIFVVADIFVLQQLIKSQSSSKLLITALLILSIFAVFTRYIGYTVAITNAVIFFLASPVKYSRKLLVSVGLIILPLALIAPWVTYRSELQNENTSATLVVNPISGESILSPVMQIGHWFLPEGWLGMGQADQVVLAGIIGFCIVIPSLLYLIWASATLLRARGKFSCKAVMHICLPICLFGWVYVISLLFFIVFLSTQMSFEPRYLTPLFIPIMSAVVGIALNTNRRIFGRAFLVVFAISLLGFYPALRTKVLISYFNGIELADKRVRNDLTHQYLRGCPRASKITSDVPWQFDLDFKEKVQWLPQKIFYGSRKVNNNYWSELSELSNIYDLVVLTKTEREPIEFLKSSTSFVLIYSGEYFIWLNSRHSTEFCGVAPADKAISTK
jgi:hypothetical protein